MTKKKSKISWKGFHRWVGLVLTIPVLVFCISGILLNHRSWISGCNVSRSLLPSSYKIENYSQGIIRGTAKLPSGKILAYGIAGVWETDSALSHFKEMNQGLPSGVDGRNIKGIVTDKKGRTWLASQYKLYRLKDSGWTLAELFDCDERLSWITLSPDSLSPVILSRSEIFSETGDGSFKAHQIKAPKDYSPRVTLFKTIWQLHSGELFGLAGRIIVDLIALVIIFLCITGIIIFFLPYSIRRSAKEKIKTKASRLKWNYAKHLRIGGLTIILTCLIAFTGLCLRPPFMVPCVLVKTPPVPLTSMSSPNAWHDKLRAAEYDSISGKWLISTSEGFIYLSKDLSGEPEKIAPEKSPAVSPMGVNVMAPQGDGSWLIGSFSGMTRWNPQTGQVTDYFTGKPQEKSFRGAVSEHLISGYSTHFAGYSTHLAGSEAIFDYSKGLLSPRPLGEMPEQLAAQPMSLWNVALELHVGRCYAPLLGPLSELYIFLSGTLLLLILISGYILKRRRDKKLKKNTNN